MRCAGFALARASARTICALWLKTASGLAPRLIDLCAKAAVPSGHRTRLWQRRGVYAYVQAAGPFLGGYDCGVAVPMLPFCG